MLKVVGVALLFCSVLFLLRDFGWRGAPVLAATASLLLLGMLADPIGEIVSGLLSVQGGTHSREISAAIKVLGIGYIFGIASDTCKTLGEAQIAKTLEVVGRVEIILIIMPYFVEIMESCTELFI